MKLNELSLLLFFTLIPCILGVMPGGISEIPVDDPEVVRLSQVALAKLNEGKRGDGASNLVEIVKASRQVVAGTLTRLTLRVSEGEKKRLCEVKIWEQPWLDKTEVTFEECSEEGEASGSTSKRSAEDVSTEVDLHLFQRFIETYKKVYADEQEYKKRFDIFRASMNKIEQLQESEQGTAQYGITQFSDLTEDEIERHLGLKLPQTQQEFPLADIPDITLPEEWDWREHNAVTPVKNQLGCGSCWAFSAVGNIEGQWAVKRGQLISLSEQELVDCDYRDRGCDGGLSVNAFLAVMSLGGLETEKDYNYTAKRGVCRFDESKIKVRINSFALLPPNEVKMAMWVAKKGPLSVGMDARPLFHYKGGVSHLNHTICNPSYQNHAVLIVGFGVEYSNSTKEEIPYWIIKNSWGTKWGEKGYFRLYRGDNTCGISFFPTSSIVY